MKETEKKIKTKIVKFVRAFWRAIGNFTEGYLVRQGYSKRIAKKMVWGEGRRGGKR